jgi:nucleoside-diphosphate-sugar epimerase
MRVFIAGATGTLGLPVVKRLVAAGHEVIGLTRKEAGREALRRLGATGVVGDALDGERLLQLMVEARPTHVLHLLTALPPGGGTRKKDLAATNELRIRGTANLIRGAIAAGAKRIVAESFPTVYGRGDFRAPLAEDAPMPPVPSGTMHDVVAALRSMESQLAAARDLIETVVLRYGYLYGADVPSTRMLLDGLRARKVPVMRGASGLGSFLHIDDAAAVTIAALEREPVSGVYNIVDDEPVSPAAFIAAAAERIGAPPPRAVPRLVMKLAAPLMVDFSEMRLPLSNAKAKRELGFAPRYPSFREGLRDGIN